MPTAEIGALRVSLSLDSAAFTAGTRAAAASANVAATGIATSFQTASTRVTASMATMGGALRNQLRAGFLQQVGSLRTGLLGLISPVGLLVGGAAALLPQLIHRENEAADAARVHADMLSRLNDEVTEARNKSPEYIQARQDEAVADLDAAQAAVAMGRARLEAYRSAHQALADQAAGMNPVQLTLQAALGVGVGGEIRDLLPEYDDIQAQIADNQALADALEAQLVQLRGQQFRSAAILRAGGTLPGIRPDVPTTPTGPSPEEVEQDRINAAMLQKQLEFEKSWSDIVAAAEQQRVDLRRAALSSVASIFGSLAQIVGDGSEKAFKISKKFAIAEAVMNTALGIAQALREGPGRFIKAAAIAASGAAQIATIVRSQPGSSATAPTVGSSGGVAETPGSGGGQQIAPQQTTIHLQGGPMYSEQGIRDLIKQINKAQPNGPKIQVFA